MDTVDLLWNKYAENNRLSTLVLEALLEAPIDNRRALAGNIVLCGGGASIPGLNRRLLEEINHQLAEERYEKLANLDYRLTALPSQPSCMSWLGGSIYACGESAWRHQIESKISDSGDMDIHDLPDWHTNPLPEPKALPTRPSVSSLSHNSPIRRMLQMSTSRSSLLTGSPKT